MADTEPATYIPRRTHTIKGKAVYEERNASPINPDLPQIGYRTSPDNRSDTRYKKISMDAGRTMEDTLVGKKVIWGGNLPGDIYGDRDTKGNLADNIYLAKTSYGQIRLQGFAEYYPQVQERVNKVSEYLRSIGLPTCRIRSVTLINDDDDIPDRNGKLFKFKAWKSAALKWFRRDAPAREGIDADEESAKAEQWLNSTQFAIEERDMQVDERIRDLTRCKTEEEFRQMIEPIFAWVNAATAARQGGLITGTAAPDKFTYTEADIKRYFGEWLPTQMGTYLGRMHKHELNHKNLTAQNWSAVGTVYDLDTMTGTPLGDPPPQSYGTDLRAALGTLEELLNPEEPNFLSAKFGKELLNSARANLLVSQMHERRGKGSSYRYMQSVISDTSYFDGHKWVKRTLAPEDIAILIDRGVPIDNREFQVK